MIMKVAILVLLTVVAALCVMSFIYLMLDEITGVVSLRCVIVVFITSLLGIIGTLVGDDY